ncbi:MAG: exodeoxyribonuclease VII large subunit, partial [Gammaproteobacteria bacterium]
WRLADQALRRSMPDRLTALNSRLAGNVRALNTVSPLATLERGYAIVTEAESDRLLRDAAQVEAGARIEARLARGSLTATVDSVDADEKVVTDGGDE